ncbi:unnamed protein product [Symbiodinium necroappetens]|uniref:SAP domain-containing protein n=1 Tax=Symbiodinium necroappetens TaxID=1628268 RepID=A0A813CEA5_9DINO|nr:unnamed protein product [Symbiodinium necroappetens]
MLYILCQAGSRSSAYFEDVLGESSLLHLCSSGQCEHGLQELGGCRSLSPSFTLPTPCLWGLRRSTDRSVCRNAVPDYSSMNVKELKARLRELGLKLEGRKAVLIERLQAHDADASEDEDGSSSSRYLDDQGLLPDGTYMCLDGKARTGDWEKARRENPDDLNWLTEWVVAARTGQLEKKK